MTKFQDIREDIPIPQLDTAWNLHDLVKVKQSRFYPGAKIDSARSACSNFRRNPKKEEHRKWKFFCQDRVEKYSDESDNEIEGPGVRIWRIADDPSQNVMDKEPDQQLDQQVPEPKRRSFDEINPSKIHADLRHGAREH